MNKCGHDDCFTCPFPDCIIDDACEKGGKREKKEPVKHTWKCGRKPLDPSEKAERKRIASRKHYYAHKEEINARHRANYYKRKKREAATA